MTARAETVTILFTDLVGSTELLQRAGDEQAQRIFKAHHRLLSEAVQKHGGNEVKWLGDGLMVAFDSAQEAVKCAIAMQQSSRRPAAGVRLEIRAGLNVGEALLDESDYFGTPVVVARRLCDRANSGQIIASDIVVRLLEGRGADLDVKELGPLDLKGITNAVPAVEIVYQHDPMALLRKLPFVGRQAEYETLLKKLGEAQNGRGSVVLLAGEPGIGKTRLTEEFCEHASSGATVIRGNSYEGDIAAPFGPWTEALRSLIEQLPDDALRDALGPGAPDIAAMLPEVRQRLPEVEEAPRLDPESERARLFDSIGAFLRNASEQRPLILFFDDLHWCDKPSLALLEHLARGVVDRRIVIVGTYRDMEVDRVHPLAQTLAALRRMEHYERVVLRGFSEESVYELMTAIEPSEQAEAAKRALASVLHAEAEGNPFFIREVLNNLIETGKLAQQDGVWTSAITSIEELGIPEGIKEVIGRRLSQLSEGCNRMLQRASAMTSGFTWEELFAVCDESEDELLDSLDEALGSQLIAERSRGAYAFTHALIRATLYDELSTPRRVRLHRRVAESLEAIYADDLDSHLGELAAHYLASMGGDAEKAIDYSIRAAERGMELVAWEEAAAHYERALEAMPEQGDDERKCTVLLALGDALLNAAQYSAALEAFREAAAPARAAGSAKLLAEAACGFEESGHFGDAERPAERLALVDEALAALGGEDSALRARLLSRRVGAAQAVLGSGDAIRSGGWGAWTGNKDPDILGQAREAVAIAERVGDAKVTATALLQLFNYLAGPGHDDERREIAEKCLKVARLAGDGRHEISAWDALFSVAMAQGDMAAAREACNQGGRRGEELRIGRARWLTLVHRSALTLAEGRLEESERDLSAALKFGQDSTAVIAFTAQLNILRYYQGRDAEMEGMWRGVVEQSPNVETFHAALTVVLAETGRAQEAAAIVDRLIARGLASMPEDGQWMGGMIGLALACARLDDKVGAAVVYEVFSRHPDGSGTAGNAVSYGAVAGFLGPLAALLERWDDAERHFQAALDLNEKMGHRPALAQTRANYGDMLLRRASTSAAEPDDRGRAVALLQLALHAAQEMGLAKVQADSERLLEEAGANA